MTAHERTARCSLPKRSLLGGLGSLSPRRGPRVRPHRNMGLGAEGARQPFSAAAGGPSSLPARPVSTHCVSAGRRFWRLQSILLLHTLGCMWRRNGSPSGASSSSSWSHRVRSSPSRPRPTPTCSLCRVDSSVAARFSPATGSWPAQAIRRRACRPLSTNSTRTDCSPIDPGTGRASGPRVGRLSGLWPGLQRALGRSS